MKLCQSCKSFVFLWERIPKRRDLWWILARLYLLYRLDNFQSLKRWWWWQTKMEPSKWKSLSKNFHEEKARIRIPFLNNHHLGMLFMMNKLTKNGWQSFIKDPASIIIIIIINVKINNWWTWYSKTKQRYIWEWPSNDNDDEHYWLINQFYMKYHDE